MTPQQLPERWRELYEERAALMDHDGLTPQEANRMALADTLARMEREREEKGRAA